MTSSPSWITVAPSAPAVGIIERRAARLPGARPGKPDITPGEYSNGAFGENHSGNDTRCEHGIGNRCGGRAAPGVKDGILRTGLGRLLNPDLFRVGEAEIGHRHQ